MILQDDLEELKWEDLNQRRRRRDNELCGYYEEEEDEDEVVSEDCNG